MRYRYQPSNSIFGAAAHHRGGIAVYQQQQKTAKARLDNTAVPTRAVYHPRELYINSNNKRNQKHFWSTKPCRPGRCINQGQQSRNISWAAVYHQRAIAVSQPKPKAKALLDHTAVSTRAVYQSRELYINSNQNLKRKNLWSTQPCRPGRCINRDRQSTSICGTAVYHQRGIAVNQEQSKSIAKALVEYPDVSTRKVYQPRSTEQSIPGAAVYHQHGVAVFQRPSKENENTSGRHSHVHEGGINRDQQSLSTSELNIHSNQKGNRMHFGAERPCRPVRYINRNQQINSISGAAVHYQRVIAVYQQQSKDKAKARLDDTAVSTPALYQPREPLIHSIQN